MISSTDTGEYRNSGYCTVWRSATMLHGNHWEVGALFISGLHHERPTVGSQFHSGQLSS